MEEEMTPERTPHIILVSNVSSESGEQWEADCNCEQAAFDTMHHQLQFIFTVFYRSTYSYNWLSVRKKRGDTFK